MEKFKNITVIGGGNIGSHFACLFANKGYDVCLYATSPQIYSGTLTVEGDTAALSYSGELKNVTDDIAVALKNCDLVYVTYPSFMFKKLAAAMEPHIKKGMHICVLPGTGGAEFAFGSCIRKGAVLSGLQRVPAVVRLIEKGKRVSVKGLRDKLYLAAIPTTSANEIAALLSESFGIPCSVLPSYLSITLTPSNPILHTTRLCSIFKDYKAGVFYKENIPFYEAWSDDASELLFKCDEQLQKLCRKIEMESGLDLSGVKSLKEHYESDTPHQLTEKIRSIKSFKGLLSPMKEVEGGFVPDFENRYFTADFPYGLSIIKALAELFECECETIDYVMAWYQSATNTSGSFDFGNFGIYTKEDFIALYKN